MLDLVGKEVTPQLHPRRGNAQKARVDTRSPMSTERKKKGEKERGKEREPSRGTAEFFATGKVLSVVLSRRISRARSCDRDSGIIPKTLDPRATSAPSHRQHRSAICVISLFLRYSLTSNYQFLLDLRPAVLIGRLVPFE